MAILVYNPRNLSSTPISQKVPRCCSWTEKAVDHWLLEPPHLRTQRKKPPSLSSPSVCALLIFLALYWIYWYFLGPVWAHMGFFLGPVWPPPWGESMDFCGDGLYQKSHHPRFQNIKWRVPTTKTYWTRMMFRQVCPMFESNPQQVHVLLVSTLQLMNKDMEKPPFGDHFPRETIWVFYIFVSSPRGPGVDYLGTLTLQVSV